MTDSVAEFWNIVTAQRQDQSLLKQANQYALDYLQTVETRPVGARPNAMADLTQFDTPLPDHPQDAAAVLQQLHRAGSPATQAQMGGRYFGFVNGGVLPTALAARWLADVWDQNAALNVMSPIAAKLEQVCEGWLVDLLGLPSGTAAGFVSGTSTATMVGAVTGRNWLLQQLGWDVYADGLFTAPLIKVVMSDQAHSSVGKALALIGIGRNQIQLVPSDAQGRLDANQMPPLDNATIVILQAGNVNSGAFDPIATVCQRAQAAGAWVHVDGAFGLWAAACEQTRALTAGIDSADSWSVDAHKTLNSPYDCGILLCKNRAALASAMQASGDYLQFSPSRDGMTYTPEMSRRARGVELWALLKSLGRSGVSALIARLCDNATLFAQQLEAAGFRVLNDVVFNQVIVACENGELTQQTLQQIQRDGVCWCSGSVWQGEPIIRISVCSWVTTAEDVKRSVQAFVAARATVRKRLDAG